MSRVGTVSKSSGDSRCSAAAVILSFTCSTCTIIGDSHSPLDGGSSSKDERRKISHGDVCRCDVRAGGTQPRCMWGWLDTGAPLRGKGSAVCKQRCGGLIRSGRHTATLSCSFLFIHRWSSPFMCTPTFAVYFIISTHRQ